VFWLVGPCDRGPLVIDIPAPNRGRRSGDERGWSLLSGFGRPREKKGIEMAERTYACSVVGSDFERDFVAGTRGKAKYQYWRSLRACDLEVSFGDIRVRSLGSVTPRKTDYQQRCADEAALVEQWNSVHRIGIPVRYWTGLREGGGKESRTRSQAHLLSDHTAVVWVEGEASCISLSHVEATQ
jgi:hypothetical protein